METVVWPCPAADGPGEGFALVAGPAGARPILIVPALFEEANRTRRMLAQTIRALAARGTASVLPDLPGCNESLAPIQRQDMQAWRGAMAAAAEHFGASHILALRGGASIAPPGLPGWWFEPLSGAAALRHLVRARTVAAKEAGTPEKSDAIMAQGRQAGLELAGYRLGAAMIRSLAECELPEPNPRVTTLKLADLGGSALWLRSEPGEDQTLSAALAATIAKDLA